MTKRFKSWVVWLGVLSSAFLAVGIDWQTLTSWQMLGQALISFLQNPASIILFGITIFSALNNPTEKTKF